MHLGSLGTETLLGIRFWRDSSEDISIEGSVIVVYNTLCEKASLLARKLNCCMPNLPSEVGDCDSDSTGGHGCNATIPKNSGSDIRGLMLASGVPENIGLCKLYMIHESSNLRLWFMRTQHDKGVLFASGRESRSDLIPLSDVFFDRGSIYLMGSLTW